MRVAVLILMLGAGVMLCGCGENSVLNRSLIFSTHTAAGVEVSVDPARTTGAPAKLLIGYSRTEGVINPVYDARGVEAPAEGSSGTVRRYREPEAYSVLAKFAGTTGSSVAGGAADAGASVAQFFATGNAALILARQPGIAGAVSGSPEIARVSAGAPAPSGEDIGLLGLSIKYALDDLAARGDAAAATHLAGLEALGALVPPVFDEWAMDGGVPAPVERRRAPGPAGFEAFNLYAQSLRRSVRALDGATDAELVAHRRRLAEALGRLTGPGSTAANALADALEHVRGALAREVGR
jgi:hypothetical protein